MIAVTVRINAVNVSPNLVSVGLEMDRLNVAAFEEKRMNCLEISCTPCWPRAKLCLAIFFLYFCFHADYHFCNVSHFCVVIGNLENLLCVQDLILGPAVMLTMN